MRLNYTLADVVCIHPTDLWYVHDQSGHRILYRWGANGTALPWLRFSYFYPFISRLRYFELLTCLTLSVLDDESAARVLIMDLRFLSADSQPCTCLGMPRTAQPHESTSRPPKLWLDLILSSLEVSFGTRSISACVVPFCFPKAHLLHHILSGYFRWWFRVNTAGFTWRGL